MQIPSSPDPSRTSSHAISWGFTENVTNETSSKTFIKPEEPTHGSQNYRMATEIAHNSLDTNDHSHTLIGQNPKSHQPIITNLVNLRTKLSCKNNTQTPTLENPSSLNQKLLSKRKHSNSSIVRRFRSLSSHAFGIC